MASEDIKLYYFPVRGRAEPIRMTLKIAGKDFDDVRLDSTQWPTKKPDAPFGQVPFLEYQGKAYGESKAIAAFAARLCGLAGKTLEDGLRVDEVFCLTGSLLEQMAKARFEQDPAKQEELKTKIGTEIIPRFLGYFEKMLAETDNGYFVAGELSQADLTVYDITHTLLKKHPTVLDACPNIRTMRTTLEQLPKVKAYLDAREDSEF